MEKVPELLTITGFLKSFLMSVGYKITFKIIKIKNITPRVPNMYLKVGWMSWVRLPKDSNARINPEIGMGIFLIKSIISIRF